MKKYFISAILLANIFCVGCEKGEGLESNASDYFYDIPQTDLQDDIFLGCHYVNPMQSIEDNTIIDSPTRSSYDVFDAATMKQHTEEASNVGVDYFVFEWDDNLDSIANDSHLLIENFKLANSSMKYIIKYQYSHLGVSASDKLLETSQSETIVTKLNRDLDFLVENYFNEDGIQEINGKPAFMINLSTTDTNIDFGYLADLVRTGIKDRIGEEPYLIAEYSISFSPPERFQTVFEKYDAVTSQNMKADNYDLTFSYFSFMDINWQLWNESLSSWGVDFVPTVWTAYYRDYESNPSQYYDLERTTDNFIDFCNVAKRNMSDSKIIMLYSWNDFKTGSALESAGDYGDTYQNVAKEQFSVK